MEFRALREIESDLRRFGAWYKELGDAMKVFGPLLTLVALGGGVYFTKGWWLQSTGYQLLYVSFPIAGIAASLIAYLTLVGYRARQPKFEVGELVADDSEGSHSFHIRVRNLGPGKHKPTVTITHLRDDRGKHLPNVPESYQPTEAHWRGATEPNWNPELKRREPAFAGVLDVEEVDTDTPYLCTYPNALCAPRRLWKDPKLLDEQRSLQLSISVSYKSSKDVRVAERSYRVIPDKTQPLKYRIERVKKFNPEN